MQSMDFGAIYERYAVDVLRFALYLSGNRADAEEIAAETFARAWAATEEIRVETISHYLQKRAAGIIARKKAASPPGCPLLP